MIANQKLLELSGLGIDYYIVRGILEGRSLNVETSSGELADKIRKRLRFNTGLQYRVISSENSAMANLSDHIKSFGYKPYIPTGDNVYCLFLDNVYREVDENGTILFQKPTSGKNPIEVACLDPKTGRRVTIDPHGVQCLNWRKCRNGSIRSNRVDGKIFSDNLREENITVPSGDTAFVSRRIGGKETIRTVVESGNNIIITHTDQKARLTQYILTLDEYGRVVRIFNVTKGEEREYRYQTGNGYCKVIKEGKVIFNAFLEEE